VHLAGIRTLVVGGCDQLTDAFAHLAGVIVDAYAYAST
jgi:hypothetical protein